MSQNNKRDMATQKEVQLPTSTVEHGAFEDLTGMDEALHDLDNCKQVDEGSSHDNTDCDKEIDRLKHGKLIPPEIEPSETGLTPVDFETAWQLGVDRRSPQKPPQKPLSSSEKKHEALHLIKEINQKSPTENRIIFDENLTLEDLEVQEEDRHVEQGSSGSVKVFKNVKGRKIVEKTLKSIQANEIMVPLEFVNSAMIPKVLALSWDGATWAKNYQEDAGPSLNYLLNDSSFLWHLQQKGQLMKIAGGLFQAILLLHKSGIKHRDVKLSNICYKQETGQVCLIDFGSSRTSQDAPEQSYAGTTLLYLPVNHIRLWLEKKFKPLTEKADVWAAAIVVLILVKEEHPVIKYVDECINPAEQGTPCKRGDKYLWTFAELKDPLPSFFLDHPDQPEIEGLLQDCLRVDEEHRWTAQEAVNYIAGCLSGQDCPDPKQGAAPPAYHRHVEASSNNKVMQECDVTDDFVLPREEMGPGPSGKPAYVFSGERYQVDIPPPSGNCLKSSSDLKALVFTSANPKSLEEEMVGKEEPRPPDPPTQCMGNDQGKGKVVLLDDPMELPGNIPNFLN